MKNSVDDYKQKFDFFLPGIIFSVQIGKIKDSIYFAGSDGGIYYYLYADKKTKPELVYNHGGYVTALIHHENRLVSAGYNGKITWHDLGSNKAIRTIQAHAKPIRKLTSCVKKGILVSVGDDMKAVVWNIETGEKIQELFGHSAQTPSFLTSMLYTCAFSNSGNTLATADRVGHIVLWDTISWKQKQTIEAPGFYTWDPVQRRHSIGGIRSLAFSPDDKFLAVGGVGKIKNIDGLEGDSRVELFDLRENKPTQEWLNHQNQGLVEWLYYLSDSILLAAGGNTGGFLEFFDLPSKKSIRRQAISMHVHDGIVEKPSGRILLVGHKRAVAFDCVPETKTQSKSKSWFE